MQIKEKLYNKIKIIQNMTEVTLNRENKFSDDFCFSRADTLQN